MPVCSLRVPACDEGRRALAVAPATRVLKTPFHSAMLGDLVKAYPNARVVMTHRRPAKVLSSLCSLQMKLRSVSSDQAVPVAVARETMSLWSALAARAVAMRRAWDSGASPGPGGGLVDVELGELHRDAMGAVRRIYSALGLQLSRPSEARMRAWLAANGRDKYGKNKYASAWFGLNSTAAQLGPEFGGLRQYDEYYCGTLFPGKCGSQEPTAT